MKQVYYTEFYESINGEDIAENSLRRYQWHYGEVPKLKDLVVTNFKELYDNVKTVSLNRYISLFRRVPVIRFDINDAFRETMVVSEKTFKKYIRKHVNKFPEFTLAELMKELPANEFLDYLKDNGLAVCPFGGEKLE